MKFKLTHKYFLLIAVTLVSVSTLFFTIPKIFGLEHRAEKHQEKEDGPFKFRLPGVVMSYVNRLYVDPDRIKPLEMIKESLKWEERAIPEVLTNFIETSNTETITVDDVSKTFDLSKIRRTKDMVEILRDALEFVNSQRQTKENLTASDLEYTAINGMLTQLDPHSIILPPKEFTEFKIGTTGKFGGLGMVVGVRQGQLTVISPIDGTPASRAGIKAGDKIIEIDEESTINMTLTESVGKLRGDPGTDVTLLVLTEKAAQPKSYLLKREVIAIPTVESSPLDNGLGYLKIRNFQDDTAQSLATHLKSLKAANGKIKGLIIDLRNNSGGLLDQAIEVADTFLESGPIVHTVGPGGHPREVQEARKRDNDEVNYPIVVLIDAGSASGAEIVAGALKENNRALIVGDRSFGKGSVQQLVELMDGSALKLTIAKYLTPLLTDIQSVGITADIQLTAVTVLKDNINLYRGHVALREEDLKQHLDEHPKGEKPFATLKYFQETKEKIKTDDPDEEAGDPYKLPDFNKDFHTLFARKLLLRTTAWPREAFMQNALPIVEETARQEEEKVAQELQKLDIDWSKGTSMENGKPKATFSTTPENGKVKAGEKITLTVTATNSGESPLYQLRGISSCKNSQFDKLEFILGKIDKGAVKSYSTTIEIPKNALDREDEVVIKFEELNKQTPEDVKFTVKTEALPRPLFAFSYQILDPVKNAPANNEDGLIQAGEDVELLVLVKNIGEGASEKTVVTLRNLSNKEILIKNGRVEVENLKPGEKKEAKISFFVKDTITPENFTVDIIVSDTIFETLLTHKITLPVVAGKFKITPAKSVLKIERNHTPLYGGMSYDSPVVSMMNLDVVLASDAKNNDWFRIPLPGDRYGWLSAKEITKLDGAEGKPSALEPFLQQLPPTITMKEPLPGIFTVKDRLPLSAVIGDDICVKHAYIFVNNDKVYFKSNKPPNIKERSQLVINTDIPLKEGPNVVIIVARDDDDLTTSKSFVATRAGEAKKAP
ncbi:MAG: MXAN_5808 family serine peptidase [Planctomycetota bacterium]